VRKLAGRVVGIELAVRRPAGRVVGIELAVFRLVGRVVRKQFGLRIHWVTDCKRLARLAGR